MARVQVLISLLVVGVLVSSGLSAPVALTGNPMASDYDIVITDAANEPDLAEHLDIDQLFLAGDPGNGPADRYYLALTVNDPDISRMGGPTSFFGRTVLGIVFLGNSSLLHELSVVLTANNVYCYVDGTQLGANDFSAAVDGGLEISLLKDLMPNMAAAQFDVLAQLDDTGSHADDQLVAFGIPEPATLGLLMLGGLGLIRRRR
ncbi:MAG: PEP-CTERM sorting domain-containing protein [Planctomycetes bacterium]|nr:PEP-CTERM sorting domain-containing protein [Planctomycetota bacterium]